MFRRIIDSVEEALQEIFFRLDDFEREGHPVEWVPGPRQLYYVVPATGERVLVCTEQCCPCGDEVVAGGSRIWRASALTGGTTWTSEGGEVATVPAVIAPYVWSGPGILTDSGAILLGFYNSNNGGPYSDPISGTGALVLTVRYSYTWGGAYGVETRLSTQLRENGFTIDPIILNGPGRAVGSAPFVPGTDRMFIRGHGADPDPNSDGDDSDATGNYASFDAPFPGWGTYWARLSVNQGTGAVSIELAPDNNGTPGSFTTVGSGTWSDYTAVTFRNVVTADVDEPSFTLDRSVHGAVIHDVELTLNGAREIGFDNSDLAGSSLIIGSTNALADGTEFGGPEGTIDVGTFGGFSIAAVPTNAIHLRWEYPASSIDPNLATKQKLWESGPTLTDPLILFSTIHNPGQVERITGVQPTDFDGSQAATPGPGWVWGVADLADTGASFWADGQDVTQASPA